MKMLDGGSTTGCIKNKEDNNMKKYEIYARRMDEKTADGYGEWDDGHDWETEGTAADALSEFIDHIAEDSEVERIDKDEIMYDGMRLELKVINKFNK